MSAHAHPPPARMSAEEFLAWEAAQDHKAEFDGSRPTAMVGATFAHAAIQRNVLVALATRLRGSRCQPFGSDTMVDVGNGRYRYPDAVVACTPLDPAARLLCRPRRAVRDPVRHD